MALNSGRRLIASRSAEAQSQFTTRPIGGRDAGGGGRGTDISWEGSSEWGAGPVGPQSSASSRSPLKGLLEWRSIITEGAQPAPRSGAASVLYENRLLLYGGYGGVGRLEDLWSFDFHSKTWTQIEYEGSGPGPRENNGVVVLDNCLYVFGGYNGYQWLNDLHQFDLINRKWRQIEPRGTPPASRFGYVSAAYYDTISGRKELIFFAGYDGTTWLNDMNVYSFNTGEWSVRRQQGEIPSIRSCPSWARYNDKVYVFGGYDGVQRMNDFWELDLKTSTWTPVRQQGTPPSARYFHSSVVYKNLLFVYGGYNGSTRLGDLYCFSFETFTWTKVETKGEAPAGRSSLVMQVHENSIWLLGGYNGREVLNDLYQLTLEDTTILASTLVDDLARLVNNKDLCDVTFLVEEQQVHAVAAILAIRSEHFRALLFGGMREGIQAKSEAIVVPDIEYRIFLLMLEYLHTDCLKTVSLDLDDAVSLLIASERFLLDRLKGLCVDFIRSRIAFNNVIHILLTSYRHNAVILKELCLDFIVSRFGSVKHLEDFQELQKEPELLMNLVMRLN